MPSSLANEIAVDALKGVKVAAAQPNDLSPTAINGAQATIVSEVAKQVEPLAQHLTNTEPWYQSRVTLGSLFTVIASIAGLLGYTFITPELQSKVIDLIIIGGPMVASIVGGAFALYGRYVARKPIGA